VLRHRTSDHLKRIVTPDFIADFLSLGQLGSPLGLVLNVLAPGCVSYVLDPAGRGVSVALTNQLEHPVEPRLSESRRPAGFLFTAEVADLDDLELTDPGLL
jgi:hypothetical protein